jgi:hypothetical protein
MGAYEKAEPLYQQALQITRKALGPEHSRTATCLNNLAELYHVMATPIIGAIQAAHFGGNGLDEPHG